LKILALSDIHGAYGKMMEIVSSTPADVIVIAGDLTTFGSPSEAENAIGQLQQVGKPLLVVAGNMDPTPLDELFFRLGVSINGRGVVVDQVGFVGVSGSPLSPLNTPNEITEDEIAARAEKGWKDIANAKIKIFVPHAPPMNTALDLIHSGSHVGSVAVREFIERHQPHVVICGHIHESRGKDEMGTTQIINCGPVGSGYYGVIIVGEGVVVENRKSFM
jgi:Icc-related predicted phosphoesterase